MKINYILLLLILLICLGGCTDKSIKPSADSQTASDVFNLINTIKTAYEGKDRIVLQNHMGNLLAGNTMKGLLFEEAGLTITPRMVTITDTSVKVNVIWSGTWLIKQGMKLENRGSADLVFHKESMKLTYIDGDNPFDVPSDRNGGNALPVLEN
ncbi:MAG: hypothetical protein AB1499_18810 [Nitrospirota bacterium]